MHVTETDTCLSVTTAFPLISVVLGGAAALMLSVGTVRHLQTPLRPADLFWASVAALGFLAAGWLTGERGVFRFCKDSDRFLWSRQRLGRSASGELPLNSVGRAQYETLHDSGDGGETYRLVIETRTGKVPLTSTYSGNLAPILVTINRINTFLDLKTSTPGLRSKDSL